MISIDLNECFKLSSYVYPDKSADLINELKDAGIQFKVTWKKHWYRFTVLTTPEDASRYHAIFSKYAVQ